MRNEQQIRAANELIDIVNYVRAKIMLEKRRKISITEVTKCIADKTDKEAIYHEIFSKI